MVIAGHSVGELTAAALAGVLSVEAAIALTAVRGRAMARACAQTPTGMSAVLGGDPAEVLAAIEAHGLTPANVNGAGQVVAAGSLDGLAALKADPPAKARVMPLSVAGAFHTDYMAPAREELEGLVGGIRPAQPSRLLISNKDGSAVETGAGVLDRLVSQVTSPVRFDACLDTLRGLGVTAVIELPPAGALAGLAKRDWKGRHDVEVLAIAGPADLDRARELIAAERGRPEAEQAPDWRMVVSPARGSISPNPIERAPGSPPARRWPPSPGAGRPSRSPPGTPASSPSGWSPRATSSTPVTRWPVSTRRSPHEHHPVAGRRARCADPRHR